MSTLVIHFKLVYVLFGQNNMHSTLDFCPEQLGKKELNVLKYHTVTIGLNKGFL